MSDRDCWACNLPDTLRKQLDTALRDRVLGVAEATEWLKLYEGVDDTTYDKIRHHRRNLHHYDEVAA